MGKKKEKSDQNAVAELTREWLYKENKWLWEENKKLKEYNWELIENHKKDIDILCEENKTLKDDIKKWEDRWMVKLAEIYVMPTRELTTAIAKNEWFSSWYDTVKKKMLHELWFDRLDVQDLLKENKKLNIKVASLEWEIKWLNYTIDKLHKELDENVAFDLKVMKSDFGKENIRD